MCKGVKADGLNGIFLNYQDLPRMLLLIPSPKSSASQYQQNTSLIIIKSEGTTYPQKCTTKDQIGSRKVIIKMGNVCSYLFPLIS